MKAFILILLCLTRSSASAAAIDFQHAEIQLVNSMKPFLAHDEYKKCLNNSRAWRWIASNCDDYLQTLIEDIGGAQFEFDHSDSSGKWSRAELEKKDAIDQKLNVFLKSALDGFETGDSDRKATAKRTHQALKVLINEIESIAICI